MIEPTTEMTTTTTSGAPPEDGCDWSAVIAYLDRPANASNWVLASAGTWTPAERAPLMRFGREIGTVDRLRVDRDPDHGATLVACGRLTDAEYDDVEYLARTDDGGPVAELSLAHVRADAAGDYVAGTVTSVYVSARNPAWSDLPRRSFRLRDGLLAAFRGRVARRPDDADEVRDEVEALAEFGEPRLSDVLMIRYTHAVEPRPGRSSGYALLVRAAADRWFAVCPAEDGTCATRGGVPWRDLAAYVPGRVVRVDELRVVTRHPAGGWTW